MCDGNSFDATHRLIVMCDDDFFDDETRALARIVCIPSVSDLQTSTKALATEALRRTVFFAGFRPHPGWHLAVEVATSWADPDEMFETPTPLVYDQGWGEKDKGHEGMEAPQVMRAWKARVYMTAELFTTQTLGRKNSRVGDLWASMYKRTEHWEEWERAFVSLKGGALKRVDPMAEGDAAEATEGDVLLDPADLPKGTGPGQITTAKLASGREVVLAQRYSTPFSVSGHRSGRHALVALQHKIREDMRKFHRKVAAREAERWRRAEGERLRHMAEMALKAEERKRKRIERARARAAETREREWMDSVAMSAVRGRKRVRREV
jgi:hypothetical protein